MGDPLAPLYVRNRRDGSRLLSSALVICTIGATQIHQHWGVLLTSVSAVVLHLLGLRLQPP